MPHALIVDDHRSNASVLALLLEQAGVTCDWISDPSEIEEALAGNPPFNVVFLDLEFPTSDGLALLPHLRALPGLAGAPFIAYSVHTSEIDTARRAGFDGFLGKPLDAVRFPQQLHRILAGEPVWAA